MAKDVKCIVDTCRYYAAGDACTAAKIEVVTDGSIRNCDCSAETNCKTFQPK